MRWLGPDRQTQINRCCGAKGLIISINLARWEGAERELRIVRRCFRLSPFPVVYLSHEERITRDEWKTST